MMRMLSLCAAGMALLTTLALTPGTRALDHGDDATPQASPQAAGHDSPVMSGTGAAYLVIRNAGAEDDWLTGGTTAVAETVEVHEVSDEGGVMKMTPLTNGLVIPAGDEETLAPGGYHIMLFGLTQDLTNGKTYDLTLRFERAGEVTVPVTVRPRAELAEGMLPAAPVVVGELTLEDAWSRPAPAFGGTGSDMPMGTAAATPVP